MESGFTLYAIWAPVAVTQRIDVIYLHFDHIYSAEGALVVAGGAATKDKASEA